MFEPSHLSLAELWYYNLIPSDLLSLW